MTLIFRDQIRTTTCVSSTRIQNLVNAVEYFLEKARSYGNILDSICTGSSNKKEQVLKILTPIKKVWLTLFKKKLYEHWK